MTKKELVEKIAKEQNLDPKKLSRLSVTELEKMDKVVPDAEITNDDDDIFGEDSPSELPSEDEGTPVVVDDMEDVEGELDSFPTTVITEGPIESKEKILVGHHPITKEPVYK